MVEVGIKHKNRTTVWWIILFCKNIYTERERDVGSNEMFVKKTHTHTTHTRMGIELKTSHT